ncbi:lysylphosphatidylglycerol synthase transmembrane domain-containing protein [Riemerella columbina]|uniref:lysylphosphatidylglycerol synthase transmembrane domain-containing protein n=1 Tax=Riemerella columbina TaxID=103810 RepID=UPI00266FBAA9|nr:lysylphosphatidylglycerol synthase transmembrane domain-containing protein [Riemerella columbina]WKS94601.1 flippase-like domain-containing protein [Riemerella columbina]
MPTTKNKKNNALKNGITILVSLIFAGVFMWLAVRGLDWDKIKTSLSKANYFWVLVAAIFGVLAYWVRAIRWNLLLEPMGYQISNKNALWSLSFGYLMNLTIPRSGEVARATALYGVEKVPVDQSFGTIILERIVDLLCMGVFLGLTLIFKYDAILAFYQLATSEQQNTDASAAHTNSGLWLIGIAILAIIFIIFRKKIIQSNLYQKVKQFILGILSGLQSIFKLKHKMRFLLLSLGIWVCYYLAAYLVCFALPETKNLGIADGFFIIVVGTLGMMVPASGGIGAFHFALKLGFMALFIALGQSPEEGGQVGLSYAFISHTMQLVIMLVMGVISIPMLAQARKVHF